MPAADHALDVTIITGMSGAGRSEAAHVLEDIGFFVIDNLPPQLIVKVAELARGQDDPTRYALVVDVRSGDFLDAHGVSMRELRAEGGTARTLFLDANDEALVRRYEASRRRHPMSPDDGVIDGIQRERELLGTIKGEADVLVDTSNLNVHELRDRLREIFVDERASSEMRLRTNVMSFGFKHGLPLDVDMVFDCRFLQSVALFRRDFGQRRQETQELEVHGPVAVGEDVERVEVTVARHSQLRVGAGGGESFEGALQRCAAEVAGA